MSRADDLLSNVQKAVGDGPLQLLVGVGDLVSEKLRELPDAVTTWQEENRDFPMRAAGALIGSVFRANLKVGELYDELTRRGQDVITKMRGDDVLAEEDEPFVHEPFMPEPVRRLGATTNGGRSAKKAASKQAASKQAASKKAAHPKHADAAMKSATARTARTSARKTATKKVGTKKPAAKTGGKKTTTS